MMTRSWLVFLLVGLSSFAFAQDDDDLVPLGPSPAAKPKVKLKPKAKVKTPVAKPKQNVMDDDLAPLAPMAAKGDLVIKLANNLAGAVLSIDGKEVGTLPMSTLHVASGEHTVTVKRPGYAAFVKKVMVPGGKTVELDAKLTATAAVLSVQSDLPGAQVLLNGRLIGLAPLNDVEVPAGPAEVAVIKEGFREESQKINFVAGKDYPVVVRFNGTGAAGSDRPLQSNLTPGNTGVGVPLTGVSAANEPITSKWYFWAGIAAGVAAIAVGTAVGVSAANTAKPLTENEICAGPCDACIGLTCKAGYRPLGSF